MHARGCGTEATELLLLLPLIAQQGNTLAHVAAAFGALDVLRYLYKSGAVFDAPNGKKMTPLEAAQAIGEEDSVLLIQALMEGKSGDEIGLGKDLDLDDELPTPRDGEARADGGGGAATKALPAAGNGDAAAAAGLPPPPPVAPAAVGA